MCYQAIIDEIDGTDVGSLTVRLCHLHPDGLAQDVKLPVLVGPKGQHPLEAESGLCWRA